MKTAKKENISAQLGNTNYSERKHNKVVCVFSNGSMK